MFIDSFDFVIRQKAKGLNLLKTKKYGVKTQAFVGSLRHVSSIKSKDWETWIFKDSRFSDIESAKRIDSLISQGIRIDPSLCDHWNSLYRSFRTPSTPVGDNIKSYPSSDKLGSKHMSSGLHAIVYAAHFLPELDTLHLVGFDSIKTGEFTWSLTRGEEWNKYPDHRWDTEYLMIPMIEKKYNIKVEHI